MRHVAAVPAVGLLAGSAFGLLAPDLPSRVELIVLCAASVAAVAAWRAALPPALVVCAGVGFAAGGALLSARTWRDAWQPSLRVAFDGLAREERAAAAVEQRLLPEDDSARAVVEATLRSDASPTPSGVSLALDATAITGGHRSRGERQPVAGGIVATVVGTLGAERMGEWRAGRQVRMPMELRRPSRYLDPGVPDSERALARRGSILVGFVKSGALVEVIGRGSRVDEAIGAARAFARRAIRAGVGRWSDRSAAIVAAIVIGDRAGLDADLQRRLQEAGTYHVIAISGGNIAILAGVLLGAFRIAGLFGRAALAGAIVLLVVYAAFVGGGASVDRATLMAVVYLAGRLIDQRGSPVNALAVVAALLVTAQPLSAADPAFVLTFGATLAILLVAPVVRIRPVPVTAILVASVATEAMLLPVGALVFSRITFAGLALNFLAIPLMALAQIAGMVVVPLALVSSAAAEVAGAVAHVGAAGLVRSADLLRFGPMLTWRVAPPSAPVVMMYYAGLATSWALWRRRAMVTGSTESAAARTARIAGAAAALTAAVWIAAEPWRLIASRGDGRLHVLFIDVGQGDASLVRFPGGGALLVDAGPVSGSFDAGDRVVAPVLRDAGIGRLDALVLTHGDPDHVGGAASIIREFRPREVWEGVPVPPLALMTDLRVQAQAGGARWANVRTGDHLLVDGVEVVARHPPPPDWERQRVRNDDSVVLELRWGEVSVLLTGDVGAPAEPAVARQVPPARIRILKVAHHGSLTSSTAAFIAATSPAASIVSAGRANRFGHPAPAVLERYASAGAEIFRTDRDGAIEIDTDGRSVNVHAFTGRTWRSGGG